jgi:hypothetical protein
MLIRVNFYKMIRVTNGILLFVQDELAAYMKESLAASDQVNFTHNKIYKNLHCVNYLEVLTCLLKTGGVLHEEEKVKKTMFFPVI